MALDYTIQFGGLTIGNGTTYQIMNIVGLEDMPDLRTSDVFIGYNDGETAGNDYVAGRTIHVDFVVFDSGVGDFPAKVEALKAAFSKGSVETAFTFQLPNRPQRSLQARCRRRLLPVNTEYQFKYGAGSVEFHATDPRIYETAVQYSMVVFVSGVAGWDATAGAGVDAGWDTTAGAGVDAGWDATVGAVGTGLQNVTNAGTTNTFPVVTFSSPTGMSAWTLTNQTTGQVLSLVQTLNTGETLVADMQIAATGKTGIPVSVGGASRYGSWVAPRTPFVLVPGVNQLRYDVSVGDQNATASLLVQSAYL